MKKFVKVLFLLCGIGFGVSAALAQAQSSSADLMGVVTDPSKAVLTGAVVTATNLNTGIARSAVTDTNGAYRIPLLPSGVYSVKIVANNFGQQVKNAVTLTVGQALTLNFEMVNIGVKDAVVIQTDTPLVETNRTSQSTTINQKLINELPINGRNFLDFTKLTTGVVEESPAITETQLPPLPTSGLSFAGLNGRANSVQVDGVDNNDLVSNGVRPTISQEAVSEFQINQSGYNAEFGRSAGGVINIVSKSGTNQFHGNAYDFFRNENLDARNAFVKSMPPFKRNQPGFTFGGPIKQDKVFFFIAYEGLFRRESAITTILADPTILNPTAGQQALINTLLASGNASYVAQGQQLQSLLTTSANYPTQSGRNAYNLLSSSNGTFPALQNSGTGSARIDYGLSDQDIVFIRYAITNNSQNNIGIGALIAPSAGSDLANRDNTFVLGETHVFRNGYSNEFRFQSIRDTFNVNSVDPFGPGYIISGVGTFGRGNSSPSDRTQRSIQFLDNFTLPSGRHNFKFGADYTNYSIDTVSAPFLGGTINFSQLPIPLGQVLGANASGQLVTALSTPSSMGGLGRPDLVGVVTTQPLTVVQQLDFGFATSINQGFGNPNASVNGGILGVYLQDSYKLLPNLSVNYGVRYDYDLQPSGAPRDNDNVGPRVGFAYDPFKNGKTVIRGGGGFYYEPLITGLSFISSVLQTGQINSLLVSANPGVTPISPNSTCGQMLATSGVAPSFCFYNQLVSQGQLTVPSTSTIPESTYMSLLGLSSATSINRSLVELDRHAVNPFSVQANLGVEHQFGKDISVSINYMFNRGLNLINSRQANALPNPAQLDVYGRPALTGRLNPTVLADFALNSGGSSIYHALSVSVTKRFSRNYQLIAAYTFSKAISDTGDLYLQEGPQDPTNTRADRSLSYFDVRHRLSLSAVIESPFNGASWYKRALADFYLSPIITARSGFPFDVQTGTDVNMDTNINDRPFGIGRNTGKGPAFFTTDLRFGRKFRFGQDSPLGLEFIFDAFNLFNRTNYKDVNNIVGAPNINQSSVYADYLENGSLNVRFQGLSYNAASQFLGFTSAYDPRILQIGMKFSF